VHSRIHDEQHMLFRPAAPPGAISLDER